MDLEQKKIKLFSGYSPDLKKPPRFCQKHHLKSRFNLEWPRNSSKVDEDFLVLVRRFLKLFPFQEVLVEVDWGRSKDRFADWDAYLDWFQADDPVWERLFSSVQIRREKQELGWITWEENRKKEKSLSLYTKDSQLQPFMDICRDFGSKQSPPIIFELEKGSPHPLRVGFKFLEFFGQKRNNFK